MLRCVTLEAMKPVELFHIGPQKSGTTWVYECLREHPEIGLPPRDTVNYFDIHYHRGREWYATHFAGVDSAAKLMDPTPTYLRSPYAAGRIAIENPQARIITCLRHPVDRAFSHYWHEKRKRRYDFRFEEILENYDLWSNWLESGFYTRLLEPYLEHFPRDQILCLVFDELERNPRLFLDRILDFAGVTRDFEPTVLNVKVNPTRPVESRTWSGARRAADAVGLLKTATRVSQVLRNVGLLADPATSQSVPEDEAGNAKLERIADVDAALIAELNRACAPEIERLEGLTGIDLGDWRQRG